MSTSDDVTRQVSDLTDDEDYDIKPTRMSDVHEKMRSDTRRSVHDKSVSSFSSGRWPQTSFIEYHAFCILNQSRSRVLLDALTSNFYQMIKQN